MKLTEEIRRLGASIGSTYGLFTLHGKGTWTRQVKGTEMGLMGPNILYGSVHIFPRQVKEPGSNISGCAGPVLCSCPGPVPV